MKKAKVAELKNGLSRYLAHVKRGGTVLVFEREQLVARIVPVTNDRSSDDRLADLERRGVIRRGKGDVRKWLRHHRPVRIPGGLLKTLLEERRAGW